MTNIYTWSTTPGTNQTADADIDWREGIQTPGSVNDSARQMMGRIAEVLEDLAGVNATGGSANAQTISTSSAFTTLAEPRIIILKATLGVTAAATLNANALGAKAWKKYTQAGEAELVLGDVVASGIYIVTYSASANAAAGAWILLNPGTPILPDGTVTTAMLVANCVTFAKFQQITTDRLLGRDTAATGNVEELTVGGGIEFTGSGGIQSSAHTGDVTKAAGDVFNTIAADAVTFAKMQNIATDSLIGRDTAASGDPENITLNATLEMTGTGALQRAALTGDVTAAAGSNTTAIANAAVTDAKLRAGTALSVVGRSANSGGNVADIAATAATDAVLRESGSVIGFGTIATAGIANDAVTNATLANMAASTFKGRITASTGDPEDLTVANAKTLLALAAVDLSDYATNTFTPILTCATPGDLNVAYTTQLGVYTKIGNMVSFAVRILTSSFTHSMASGNVIINGMPVTVSSTAYAPPAATIFGGFTAAGFTQVHAQGSTGTASLIFRVSGPGVAPVSLVITDLPTSGTVNMYISGHYYT